MQNRIPDTLLIFSVACISVLTEALKPARIVISVCNVNHLSTRDSVGAHKRDEQILEPCYLSCQHLVCNATAAAFFSRSAPLAFPCAAMKVPEIYQMKVAASLSLFRSSFRDERALQGRLTIPRSAQPSPTQHT